MKDCSSDKRILAILGSGQDMIRTIDPEGILSSGHVGVMSFEMSGFSCNWMLEIGFPHGDVLTLCGTLDEEDTPLLKSFSFTSGDRTENLPINASVSALQALSGLDDIPAGLKACLGEKTVVSEDSGSEVFSVGMLRALVFDALLYGVDYADSGVRGSFDSFSLRFTVTKVGHDVCMMVGRIPFVSGNIYVGCQADGSGLGKKSVRLQATVGRFGHISSVCTSDSDGMTRPSITVAFLIAGMLMEEDSVQRRKRETMIEESSSLPDPATTCKIIIDEGCYDLFGRGYSEEQQRIIDNNELEKQKQEELRVRKSGQKPHKTA